MSINCNICGKEFKYKSEFERHKNKKLPCKKKEDLIHDIYNKLLIDYKELKYKNDLLKEQNDILKDKNEFLKIENNNLKEKINKIELKFKKIKLTENNKKELSNNTINNNSNNTINNNSNNTININSNNTININPIISFGKEDLSFIDKNKSNYILSKGFQSIQEFVKTVHFNSEKKEYHNVYIPNWRDKRKILVYNDNKWEMRDYQEVLEELKNNGIDFIQTKFEELSDEFKTDRKFKNLQKFLDQYNDLDDEEIETNIDNDLLLILYNHRDLVCKKISNK
jgi:hypothetical protein